MNATVVNKGTSISVTNSGNTITVITNPVEVSISVGNVGPPGPKGDAGPGATWGGITGTLSDQTDLKNQQDTQDSAITLNTAKTGITAQQSADITTNNAKISYTDSAAVALNTAKVSNANHTGDASGNTTLTFATVNSNVGSFTNADITVNAKGLVTAASDGTGGGFTDQEQLVYVSKVGSDSSSGLNVEAAKLTIGAAITAASGMTPTVSNQVTIQVIDAGTYAEEIVFPEWVHLHAPNATQDGRVDVSNNCVLTARRFENTLTTSQCIRKTDSGGLSKVTADLMVVAATQEGVRCDGGQIGLTLGTLSLNNSEGLLAKNGSRIVFNIQYVSMINDSDFIKTNSAGGSANAFYGECLRVEDDNTSRFLVTNAIGDMIDVQAGSVAVQRLYNLGQDTILNLYANTTTGTRIDGSGTFEANVMDLSVAAPKLDGIEDLAEVNNISDANATDLTDGTTSTLHFHATDRARANHTGTQAASTISDFDTEVANNSAVALNTDKSTNVTTNLTTSQTTTTVDIISSDGTDATIPQAIASGNAGAMSGADKNKLDDIADNAEVNNISDTDATDLTDGGETTLHSHSTVITADMDLITGVTTGGEVTNGTNADEFTIAAGTGIVIDWTDPTTPVRTEVSWSEFTDVVIPVPASFFTPVLIDVTGSLVLLSGVPPTPNQLRSLISLQTVLHVDSATVTSITGSSVPSYEVMHSILDYIRVLGSLNTGNNFSANGANLLPDKSVGTTAQPFINRTTDPQNPSTKQNAIEAPLPNYVLNYQNGSGGFTVEAVNTAVDPDSWDDGSGTKATVANNKWTIQRFYYFGTVSITSVTLGQAEYGSSAEAKENILAENPAIDPSLAGAKFRAALVIKKGATDLSDVSQAEFVTISNLTAGGGGLVAQSFQDTYDISDLPQILTNAAKLAFQVQQGSGSDTDKIYEGLNGAGSTTFSVNGAGNVTGEIITSKTNLVFGENNNGNVNTSQLGFLSYNSDGDEVQVCTINNGSNKIVFGPYVDAKVQQVVFNAGGSANEFAVDQTETVFNLDSNDRDFIVNKNTSGRVIDYDAGTDVVIIDSSATVIDGKTVDSLVTSDPSAVTGADQIINMMSLTQAEYDAIGTPNASTFYVITDA